MKLRITAGLTGLLGLLPSCSITADLYPTAGPLTQTIPRAVLKATIHGVLSNSGRITMNLPGGEVGSGNGLSQLHRPTTTFPDREQEAFPWDFRRHG